jgi:hypothetical protein
MSSGSADATGSSAIAKKVKIFSFGVFDKKNFEDYKSSGRTRRR